MLMTIVALAANAFSAPPAPPPQASAAETLVAGVGGALPVPPEDWSSLPPLRFQRRVPQPSSLSSYVRDEVRAGRCATTAMPLRVDLAVLVAADGQLRRIRPKAIGCPTVEQYASGLMVRMARRNVASAGEDRWYRTELLFQWK